VAVAAKIPVATAEPSLVDVVVAVAVPAAKSTAFAHAVMVPVAVAVVVPYAVKNKKNTITIIHVSYFTY
jgi:hypothetical protein